MSQKSSDQTTPLPKSYRKVKRGEHIDIVKIIGLTYGDEEGIPMVEVIKVMVHPMTDDEFYAELHMEDYGLWTFVD
jgi:hypothetical protein